MRNVMVRGNSRLLGLPPPRPLASMIERTRSTHSWRHDGAQCHLAEVAKLDDCAVRLISIGPLGLQSIDFDDAITLGADLRLGVNSPERTERNRRTIVALPAGVLADIAGEGT